ncbi:replication protein A 70 kDa DNA-binding subunit A [Tanacetum coccineum]
MGGSVQKAFVGSNRANSNKYKIDPLDILDRVRMNNTLADPMIIIRSILNDSKDKDSRVIFVLNMEIIIFECEIIGNPRDFLPSNPSVKARVTGKGDLRGYNKVTGDGEVFSFDLLNSDGGKICVTRFNAQHSNVIAATKILRNATTSIFFNKEMEKYLEECDYKYLLQCQVQDHTGLTWVTDFQEVGEEIVGCSTKELYLKNQVQDDERFSNADKSHLFAEVLLKLKVKEETYGDEQRLKVIVVKSLDSDSITKRVVRTAVVARATSGQLRKWKDKSDVYSFGVVLSELISSKVAVDFNRKTRSSDLRPSSETNEIVVLLKNFPPSPISVTGEWQSENSIGTIIGSDITCREIIAEVGIDLIVTSLEQGIGIATASEVTTGMQKISVECEKEVADVIAHIRLEYGNKRQEAFEQNQEHQ